MGFEERRVRSIETLRKAASVFLPCGKFGDKLVVAFSGGKDSQAIYHLAEEAGVPFEAVYNATSIDPAEVVRFIHECYPRVRFEHPRMSFWECLLRHKSLPTRFSRFCCAELKERFVESECVVTGVRRSESVGRKNRTELSLNRNASNGKKEYKSQAGIRRHFVGTIDEFVQDVPDVREMPCMTGRNKVVVSPILEWSEADVWWYLDHVIGAAHCSLYDERDGGYDRVGCLFCCSSTMARRIKDARRKPLLWCKFRETVAKIYPLSNNGKVRELLDGDDYLRWWFSYKSIPEYCAEAAGNQLCDELFPQDVIERIKQYHREHVETQEEQGCVVVAAGEGAGRGGVQDADVADGSLRAADGSQGGGGGADSQAAGAASSGDGALGAGA